MSKFFKNLGRKGVDLVKRKMDKNGDGETGAAAFVSGPGPDYNIVVNPTFTEGTLGWFGLGCSLSVGTTGGSTYCIGYNRKEPWQGIAQEIGERLETDVEYKVEAWIGIGGNAEEATVSATLKVEHESANTDYCWIGSAQVTRGQWVLLSGKLRVSNLGQKAVLYMEGPRSGVDIFVSSVAVVPSISNSPLSGNQPQMLDEQTSSALTRVPRGLIQNHTFEDGLKGWTPKGCQTSLSQGMNGGAVRPCSGKYFVVASGRTEGWQGIEQDITGRIEEGTLYVVTTMVRINGPITNATVLATLFLSGDNVKDQYMTLGSVNASNTEWTELTGKFLVNKVPKRATVYLEGPPGGVDILVDSLSAFPPVRAKPAGPPTFKDPKYGANIVRNSNFDNGLADWFPQGSCRLNIASGSPSYLGVAAQRSFITTAPPALSGTFLLVTNRSYDWEGPAQIVTDRIQLFMSYQVTAWVATRSHQAPMSYKVDVCLSVDGKWLQGGEVMAGESWTEIVGSFRLEKKPEKVMVYLQGPGAGVDMMVAGLQIFAVDRLARVPMLRDQADKVRKRDVVVRLRDSNGNLLPPGTRVSIKQTSNSFPIGSAINHYSLENKAYKKYFAETFNWAVFENELKWGWIEQTQGVSKFENADELLEFCLTNGIQCRGHCILWETDDTVQDWLKILPPPQLAEAVQNRVSSLLSRYKGKFRHYDVNNEMLHGSFYKNKLGPQFLPYVFQLAHQFDPEAVLFVNDYHIEDGCDCNSSPSMYIEHIQDLRAQGAPIGGIGLQGHLDVPVGPVICQALDQLGTLGIPVWFTEVDVESINEFVRADDLEVVLREAFAHPSVEGFMLWGFWEGTMCRKNAQLVDSDKRINAAGLRLSALKREWLTNLESETSGNGEVVFRGFHGTYTVSVEGGGVSKNFEVVKGVGHLQVDVAL